MNRTRDMVEGEGEGLLEKYTVVRRSLVHRGTVNSLRSLVGRYAKREIKDEA